MSEYLINSSTMKGIANAIRSKTGTTAAFTPSQMITEIENIEKAGQDIMPTTYFRNSTITSYTGDANYILGYAFQECINLSFVSFPNCTYIARDAFYGCKKLETVYFPKCTYIYESAFLGCSMLSSLYLTQVESVPFIPDLIVFGATPLDSVGTGKIYIPSSLYNAFCTASFWSDLSARFVSV